MLLSDFCFLNFDAISTRLLRQKSLSNFNLKRVGLLSEN
nr:MAG TPA: hypothetical protein [Herelleviridae sp.]